MKILVIDDERIFPFSHEDDVTYARTSAEAIHHLAIGTWDEVWFDHDLGGDDTGMKVVEWMEQINHTRPGIWHRQVGKRGGRFYVHSMNSVAAPIMRSILKDFGVVSLRVTLPEGTTTIHT
jgi:hypothetical protein